MGLLTTASGHCLALVAEPSGCRGRERGVCKGFCKNFGSTMGRRGDGSRRGSLENDFGREFRGCSGRSSQMVEQVWSLNRDQGLAR